MNTTPPSSNLERGGHKPTADTNMSTEGPANKRFDEKGLHTSTLCGGGTHAHKRIIRWRGWEETCFDGEKNAARVVSPPAVLAAVRLPRDELVNKVALRTHNLHTVVARSLSKGLVENHINAYQVWWLEFHYWGF